MELIKITIILITVTIVTLIKHVFSLHLNDRIKRLVNAPADYYDNIRYDAYLRIHSDSPSSCTGSIIDEKFILTAAHCVVKPNTNQIVNAPIEVITAVTNLFGERHVTGWVEKVYVPSMYKHDANPYYSLGDIAVLKLQCKLGLGIDYNFKKLTLPYEETNYWNINQHAGKSYQFSGFGATQAIYRTSVGGTNIYDKISPSHLHFADATVFNQEDCGVIDNYYQMCATISNFQNAGVCSGDSGGALVDTTQLTVVGIANYGRLDCIENRNYPTVYTRVSSFLDFILSAQADRVTYRDIYGFPSDIRTQIYQFSHHPNHGRDICSAYNY